MKGRRHKPACRPIESSIGGLTNSVVYSVAAELLLRGISGTPNVTSDQPSFIVFEPFVSGVGIKLRADGYFLTDQYCPSRFSFIGSDFIVLVGLPPPQSPLRVTRYHVLPVGIARRLARQGHTPWCGRPPESSASDCDCENAVLHVSEPDGRPRDELAPYENAFGLIVELLRAGRRIPSNAVES